MMRIGIATALVLGVGILGGCSSSSSSSTGNYSSDKPSAIISTVGTAVSVVGSGLSSSAGVIRDAQGRVIRTGFTSSNCDSHGGPQVNSAQINVTNTSFPGMLTYCKLTTNDYSPETVQGAFAMPQSISCAAEKAGIQWDGTAHSLSVTFDTTCFNSTQLSQMGMTSGQTVTLTVTGSKPAAFNSYFDRGVHIVSTDMGVDYTLGTKITSDAIEFFSYENDSTTKQGAFAGSLNLTTGQLRYEGRMERINCTTASSCGWNRHVRAFADLTITNGTPSALKDFSLAYSNIQAPPGQNGYGGYVVSSIGNLTTGVKARGWNATNGSGGAPAAKTDYDTAGNWSEVANTYCYTSTSDTATTCGSGLPLFSTNTNFLLNAASHTSPSALSTAYAGMTFTQVDLDKDTQ